MTTTYDEVLELFRQVAEAQRDVAAAQKETERLIQEQSRATDRKLNKLEALFTSQWGKLVESLISGRHLVRLLNERNIPIVRTSRRVDGTLPDGGNYEFDIIAHNGDSIVVVEVKTTLRPDDVKDFIEKLSHIRSWIPEYADKHVHGAMAWLTADAGAEKMVVNRGLFSIRATGDSAFIQNEPTFTPRVW
jgi:Holliday junction resolvase